VQTSSSPRRVPPSSILPFAVAVPFGPRAPLDCAQRSAQAPHADLQVTNQCNVVRQAVRAQILSPIQRFLCPSQTRARQAMNQRRDLEIASNRRRRCIRLGSASSTGDVGSPWPPQLRLQHAVQRHLKSQTRSRETKVAVSATICRRPLSGCQLFRADGGLWPIRDIRKRPRSTRCGLSRTAAMGAPN
jgi:hypothetical protein